MSDKRKPLKKKKPEGKSLESSMIDKPIPIVPSSTAARPRDSRKA